MDRHVATRVPDRTETLSALPPRKQTSRSRVLRSRERNCSVARTLNIVSDAWGFLIIREAFFGARSFQAFRSALAIPRATLTDRLRKLTRQRIFRKVATSKSGLRKEYRLTKVGFDLYPSFIALMQFGDRWLTQGRKAPLTLIHDECGGESHPIVACSACLQEAKTAEVSFRDGPGAGATLVRTGRNTRRSSDGNKFLIGRPSSVSRALQVIGDKWSFMIVREAFFGARRYERIQSSLHIAPNILTDRLSRLVAAGIFRKRQYQDAPVRHEYVLTRMGLDLYGPFLAMMAWGDRWLSDSRPPLLLTHSICGQEFHPVVICDRCRTPINAGVMRYRLSYDPGDYGATGPRDVRSSKELSRQIRGA
jgi:DNA-binding HxlR family transcriptional regulator